MGSTDVVEALGLSPWDGAGPMRMFLQKTSSDPETDADERAVLEWGHLIEPVILSWYEGETGRRIIPGGHVPHRTESWLWASLDGFCEDRNIEVKNVGANMAWHWDAYAEDGVPRYVRAQVLIGQACSGKRLTDVVASLGGRPPAIWTVAWDEELAELLIEGGRAFWNQVLEGRAPPLDHTPAAKEYLRRKYPGAVDRSIVEATEEADKLGQRRALVANQLRMFEREKDRLDAMLLEQVGEHDGLQGNGWKMTWRAGKNGGPRKQRFTDRGGGEE